MKPKTKLVPGAESVDLVANGEAEMALANTPAIVARKGVELVGSIPSELYDTKDFAFKIGIGAKVQQIEAATALIQYLSGPDARPWLDHSVQNSSLGHQLKRQHVGSGSFASWSAAAVLPAISGSPQKRT